MPAKGNRITYDATVPNFGARVTAAGARSFVLNYRVRGTGQQRRYTIGDAADWSTGAARQEARRLRRLVDEGGDPLGDIADERAAPTVNELIDRFLTEHVEPRLRPATVKAYRQLLTKHARPALGRLKVTAVDYAHVDRLHRQISADAPYVANRLTQVLSKMFALSIRWRMREDNPVKGVSRNYESKRRRYLSGDELPRLIEALAAYPDRQASNIIRMLLLTGARLGEVLTMRWADIAEVEERGAKAPRLVWTKPASTTKQKADHVVPLGAPAAALLNEIRGPLGIFVFPSSLNDTGHIVDISRAWRAICRAAGITGLRVHDLRHSFASQLVSSGASLPLIGALLGHSNPKTTSRYAHMFDDPMRKAVDTVGAVITAAGKRGHRGR